MFAQHQRPPCLQAERTTHAITALHAMRREFHIEERAAQIYYSALLTGHGYSCAYKNGFSLFPNISLNLNHSINCSCSFYLNRCQLELPPLHASVHQPRRCS